MNHNPLDSPDYSFKHAHSWDKTLNHLFEHRRFDPSGSDKSGTFVCSQIKREDNSHDPIQHLLF